MQNGSVTDRQLDYQFPGNWFEFGTIANDFHDLSYSDSSFIK